MSTQITVRLPDDLVALIDEAVANGAGSSRAGVVARALQRERRRQAAERDALIYANTARDSDLDEFVKAAAEQPS